MSIHLQTSLHGSVCTRTVNDVLTFESDVVCAQLWKVSGGDAYACLSDVEQVYTLALTPATNQLITAGYEGTISVRLACDYCLIMPGASHCFAISWACVTILYAFVFSAFLVQPMALVEGLESSCACIISPSYVHSQASTLAQRLVTTLTVHSVQSCIHLNRSHFLHC